MKLKLTFFIALSFLSTSLSAKTSFIPTEKAVGKLEARVIAKTLHGRTANILSNRKVKSCQRVVVKTVAGERETIELCKERKSSKKKLSKPRKSRNSRSVTTK